MSFYLGRKYFILKLIFNIVISEIPIVTNNDTGNILLRFKRTYIFGVPLLVVPSLFLEHE